MAFPVRSRKKANTASSDCILFFSNVTSERSIGESTFNFVPKNEIQQFLALFGAISFSSFRFRFIGAFEDRVIYSSIHLSIYFFRTKLFTNIFFFIKFRNSVPYGVL